MWIKQFNVKNCRLLNDVSIQLSPNLNVLIGENASGKTSFLEALSLLSTGRSFRTSHINDVISHKKKELLVTATVVNNELLSNIGIEKSQNKTKIRIDKKDIFSQAELSRYLPITVIHPESTQLITGAPSYRRSFVDWIAFYLFSDFHSKWKSYKHILKQRNQCLKNIKHRYALDKWTEELILLQPDIIRYRESAIKKTRPIFKEISQSLLKDKKVNLSLLSGLPSGVESSVLSLRKHYSDKLENDIYMQRTSTGVHRADLKIMIDSSQAEKSASRGQLKLLSIALLLSQSIVIGEENKGKGILLFDDFSSELDGYNEGNLFDFLLSLKQQIIITSTRNNMDYDTNTKVFHVKHGEVGLGFSG